MLKARFKIKPIAFWSYYILLQVNIFLKHDIV